MVEVGHLKEPKPGESMRRKKRPLSVNGYAVKALVQGLTSVETGAWEKPVIALIKELAPTPVWPITTTLKTSCVLVGESLRGKRYGYDCGGYGDTWGDERELTLSLRASSWAIFFKRLLTRDALESFFRRKAGRKCMPVDCRKGNGASSDGQSRSDARESQPRRARMVHCFFTRGRD